MLIWTLDSGKIDDAVGFRSPIDKGSLEEGRFGHRSVKPQKENVNEISYKP